MAFSTLTSVSSMLHGTIKNKDNLDISNPLTTSATLTSRYLPTNYNSVTNTWTDTTGANNIPSSRITNTGLSVVTTTSYTKNAINSFSALQGTNTSIIGLTTTAITNYTLFFVARYTDNQKTPTYRGLIFNASGENFNSGFHNGSTATANHVTARIASFGRDNFNDGWFISTDSSSLYKANGVTYSTSANGGTTGGSTYLPQLWINNVSNNASNFQIADILLYNSYLSGTDISNVEIYLSNLYGIMINSSPTIGSYTSSTATLTFTTPIDALSGTIYTAITYDNSNNKLVLGKNTFPSNTISLSKLSTLSTNRGYPVFVNYRVGATTKLLPISHLLTLPAAPVIGTVTISGNTATVPFTAVSGNGSILYYTVTSNPAGYILRAYSSPITIVGLKDATTYTFTMTATNASGTSASSASSNSVTSSGANLVYTQAINGTVSPSGVITSNGTAKTISFTTSAAVDSSSILVGTFVTQTALSNVNLCIVSGGGGGGGGTDFCGGGGGGGGAVLIYETGRSSAVSLAAGTVLNIYVGTGGSTTYSFNGSNRSANKYAFPGSNSYIEVVAGSVTQGTTNLGSNIVATNAGFAPNPNSVYGSNSTAWQSSGFQTQSPGYGAGAGGGGGASASFNTSTSSNAGGLGNSSGKNGGNAYGNGLQYAANGGGGGGGGGVDSTAGGNFTGTTTTNGGNGGAGTRFQVNSVFYGGGGGGGVANNSSGSPGSGGNGGGGAGAKTTAGTAGTANTGGGGGGGGTNNAGGNGANGIVIINFTY